ncbi:hypothetical protein [Halobacillus naozhouensis]|uniref:Spore coat protein W n=1 Tax=Halobacillus naozhouensis TaxID=554880 RepID=A0ABY8J5L8_9BACI|nr:hypothetical protein [Halobacillus naozhouensis]WFT76191.1 hypothetical protein P9989_07450 [Halobacillus naozhouensis]
MSNNNDDFQNISGRIIDMIVGSTLKKHGVKLDPNRIDPEQREEIKKIVEDLRKSADSLTKKTSEEDNSEKDNKDETDK